MANPNRVILILNSGSSSLKWALYDLESEEHVLKGVIESIGTERIKATVSDRATQRTHSLPLEGNSYHEALLAVKNELERQNITDDKIYGIGHRVVHGGEKFTQSIEVNDQILSEIKALEVLAPLHNPANCMGIEIAQTIFPQKSHIAVFDTSFHQTLKPEQYLYPIDYELYDKYQVRRYGFHGTSHRYVAQSLAKFLGKDYEKLNVISAHLGNGSSICAIQEGKSVQTTMGLTPLDGLMMGTRSGAIDPGIFDYLSRVAGYDIETITAILNKKSGILGVSGISYDLRVIEEKAQQNDSRCALALDLFCYKVAEYTMSLSIHVDPIDALIFTGGIGENSFIVREKVMALLKNINVRSNSASNAKAKGSIVRVSEHDSLAVYKVSTDEEKQIAYEVIKVKGGL